MEGRNAVVTGGYGRIGIEISLALLDAGARVTIADVQQLNDVEKAEKSILEASFYKCDITDLQSVSAHVRELERRIDGIDIWVNAAYPYTKDWLESGSESAESWCRNVDMQMNSCCLYAAEVARHMAERSRGAIVNVASIYGSVAPDFLIYEQTDMCTPAAYSAIKGGIIAHSRYLASQFGRQGVRVNAICPGGVAAGQDAEFVDAYSRRTVLGRMAEASEIGPPVVFLASEAASYVTGATLMIDGGWTAI